MAYRVTLKKSVVKSLEGINEPYYSKIKKAIYALANDPRPPGCKKLTNRDAYRIRVSDNRIIYDIFDDILEVNVINLGHRQSVYE
jgi:mRNA interferase RelE/StbE